MRPYLSSLSALGLGWCLMMASPHHPITSMAMPLRSRPAANYRGRYPPTFLASLPIPSSSSSSPSSTRKPEGIHALRLRRGGSLVQVGSASISADGFASGAGAVTPVHVPSGGATPSGKSSLTKATFNLIKNILGSGVLALPAGVAAFSSNPVALVPATALVFAMAGLSAYCFSLIARVCEMNKCNTYMEAWENSIGKKSAWIVNAACTFKTTCACIMYSIIIGDAFSSLYGSYGLPKLIAARTNVIGWMTTSMLLPLCLLQSFDKLAPFSILGIMGTLFTTGVVLLRLFDGSYSPGGVFYSAVNPTGKAILTPGSPILNPMVFVLVSMLSTAYIAHYNAPKFYRELDNATIPRLNKVVGVSFAVCMAAFALMMGGGFLTFGATCQGFLLNNYANQDQLARLCRLAIGVSILAGYPLTFIGVRDGILGLLGKTNPSAGLRKASTVGLLGAISILAVFLRDVGFVASFGGAILGSAIIYIFPALIFLQTVKNQVKSGEIKDYASVRTEVVANKAIVGLGVVFAVIGASVSIIKTFILPK